MRQRIESLCEEIKCERNEDLYLHDLIFRKPKVSGLKTVGVVRMLRGEVTGKRGDEEGEGARERGDGEGDEEGEGTGEREGD